MAGKHQAAAYPHRISYEARVKIGWLNVQRFYALY